MIVGSLLLILLAVVLLVLGLMDGSSPLLISSIAASLAAAVALAVGVRQAAGRVDEEHLADGADEGFDGFEEDDTGAARTTERVLVGARAGRTALADPPAAPTGPMVPAQPAGPPGYPPMSPAEPVPPAPPRWEAPTGASPSLAAPVGDAPTAPAAEDDFDDEDPPDEPAPQAVSEGAARIMSSLMTEVLVIDGRPRYHLPGCVHLLGRESEPLPASEAVELGFTPCSLCEPATVLLPPAGAGA